MLKTSYQGEILLEWKDSTLQPTPDQGGHTGRLILSWNFVRNNPVWVLKTETQKITFMQEGKFMVTDVLNSTEK